LAELFVQKKGGLKVNHFRAREMSRGKSVKTGLLPVFEGRHTRMPRRNGPKGKEGKLGKNEYLLGEKKQEW